MYFQLSNKFFLINCFVLDFFIAEYVANMKNRQGSVSLVASTIHKMHIEKQ